MGQVSGVLRIVTGRGVAPVLAAPIPDLTCLPLPYMTALAVREFLLVTDYDEVEVCGHTFHVMAWQRVPSPGLVLSHHCCGVHE